MAEMLVFEGDLFINEIDAGSTFCDEILVRVPGTTNQFNLAALIKKNRLDFKRVKITIEAIEEPVPDHLRDLEPIGSL